MDSPLAKIIMIGVAVGLSVAITILAISIFNDAASDINADTNRIGKDILSYDSCILIGGRAETTAAGVAAATGGADYGFCVPKP